jgi:hypothetical protein
MDSIAARRVSNACGCDSSPKCSVRRVASPPRLRLLPVARQVVTYVVAWMMAPTGY